MYDLIIIGAGPAGMTAGIYAARKKLKTLIISKDIGGQMVWSSDVENYTGFSAISGVDLTEKFRHHLELFKEDLEIKEGLEVTDLEKNITTFEVTDHKGMAYYSKAVIIASGKKPMKLHVPGEDTFYGRGVSTCAICDAPLYKNKDVVVVGGGNSALDALYTLSKIARKIYCINSEGEIHGDSILKNKVLSVPNITYFNHAQVVEIHGERYVQGLTIRKADGINAMVSCQGVFIEIGYEAEAKFDNLTQKNMSGEIKVDANLQTSVPGIFAAGDINDAWGEQIVIAAGEGAKAALAAAKYLHRL